jgi:hypothetical protein
MTTPAISIKDNIFFKDPKKKEKYEYLENNKIPEYKQEKGLYLNTFIQNKSFYQLIEKQKNNILGLVKENEKINTENTIEAQAKTINNIKNKYSEDKVIEKKNTDYPKDVNNAIKIINSLSTEIRRNLKEEYDGYVSYIKIQEKRKKEKEEAIKALTENNIISTAIEKLNQSYKEKGLIIQEFYQQIQEGDEIQEQRNLKINFTPKINENKDTNNDDKIQPSTEIVLQAINNITKSLQTDVYSKDALFIQGDKFNQEYFPQIDIIDKYLKYLSQENKLIYENTKITIQGSEILIIDYIKQKQKEFQKIFEEFKKSIENRYDENCKEKDNQTLIILTKNLVNKIQSDILDPIKDNILDAKKINPAFSENFQEFTDTDNDFSVIKNNLLKDFNNSNTMIGKIKGKFIKQTGSKYSSKELTHFKENGDKKENIFANPNDISLMIKKIELKNGNTNIKALALNIDIQDKESVSFDCENLLSSVEKTKQFSSSPIILTFNNSTNNKLNSYAKLSSNGNSGQSIEISGPGMFVELTNKKLPDLSKIINGLDSIFIMQNSSGQLGFYDKRGLEIRNKDVCKKIQLHIKESSLLVNGQDINKLAKEINQHLEKEVPKIDIASGLGVGRSTSRTA